ncbi:hypothetical protein J7I80_21465 [Bacillus sp. ISL-41]|uniref:hypothetical protein n=1 Tax=Bacillus sp. ISL-41 TaxID=2819127 RepID=UPI001BEBD10F|nr:hypothetical protein [Bacillus sp. ISL-41]MBT2644789.1 hypothetical protein [Bacillus sp. ISL-41]
MDWSQWLQGGPFLEVSFLLEHKEIEKKSKAIQDIINKLPKLTTKVEIIDENVDEIIDFFDRGYPYDEEDPETNFIHSLRLRVFVHLPRKRKANLQIEMVSSNSIMVNFWFYGSIFDAFEWDQIGIKKEEIKDFTIFLIELYSLYEFRIGAIAIEEDVLELFGCGETYPNECYCYENVNPDCFLQEASWFINIIWNEKCEGLSRIPYNHKRLHKEGILIETGSFDLES